jgi:uncharacterized phage protein gp47/JayE
MPKEEILNEMLSDVSNTYDKLPGSFIYDALAPVADRLEKTDESIQETKDKISIENLSGDELAQRVKERTGILRKEATNAVGIVTLTGTGTINIGDLFETEDGIQFKAIETKSITNSGTVNVEAVIAGPSGNVPANTIILFPVTIAGFTAVTNNEPTTDGFEAESDADLLQRYYDQTKAPATSGNKAHYKNWAKEVAGVGDAKVFPLWNGNNTVKVVIINQDRQPASTQLVQDTQDHLDPGISGLGEGTAPIGAFVTVASATGLNIDVSVTIVLSAGYTLEQATNNITASLTQYLKDIAFVESIVSYAKTGSTILATEGVEDHSNLTINGGTMNIPIGDEENAVLGVLAVVT